MEIWRILLHSSAALVWIGVYGLGLADGPSIGKNVLGWSAYIVLVATGMWAAIADGATSAALSVQLLLFVKIAVAIGSGACGAMFMVAHSTKVRQGAALATLILAAVAAFLGVQLAPAI